MLLSKRVMQLLSCSLCVGVSSCLALHAQERCSVEVKLLLSPEQSQSAKSTLNVKNEVGGLVYFFDTDSLDLLAKGLILRLRRGAASDLTIKLRPREGKKFFAAHEEGFKCEEDFTGDGAIPSYSISRKYTGEQLPETGADITRLLSPGQKKLLKEANISIDWLRVKRIVEIKATTWETRKRKLTLEAWEWPDGKILEISTKATSGDGPTTYAELQKLAAESGLSLRLIQGFKTGIVLESVTHAKAK
jgi:hypothetical protein